MNKIAKTLIGIGVVGVTALITGVVVKKRTEKKYAKIDITEQAVINDHVDDCIIARIKIAAEKKAVRILAWVIVHKDQVEAIATVIGLFGGVLSVINAVNDYNHGKELHRKIDMIYRAWDPTIIAYDKNWQMVLDKLHDIHLDMGMLHEIHESLIPNAA